MTRKLALVAGALFTMISAGALHAQSSSTAKPNTSSMQHTRSTKVAQPAAHQDSTTAKSAKKHWTKEQITEAQQGLAKGGFYKGQPNGVYDSKTKKAVEAYQKSNKMKVTGQLSDSLLIRLRTT